eukprot:gene10877-12692_t
MGAKISIVAFPQDDKTIKIPPIDDNPLKFYFAKEYESFSSEEKEKLKSEKYAVVREYRLYTIYQGVLVHFRKDVGPTCTFKDRLAHGSWYDIEVCVEGFNGDGTSQFYSFLTSGIYCSKKPPVVPLSTLLQPGQRLEDSEWVCKNKKCKHKNYSSIRICKSCSTHNLQKKLSFLTVIPGLNIPLGVTVAVLSCGKASITESTDDIVEACLETLLATTNIALTPFFVSNIITCFSRLVLVDGVRSLSDLLVKFPYQEAFKILTGDSDLARLITNRGVKRSILDNALKFLNKTKMATSIAKKGLLVAPGVVPPAHQQKLRAALALDVV